MNLDEILKDTSFKNYINDIYSIDTKGYPFLSYVGINFNRNSILNYKFYFSFFNRLNDQEIQKALPVKNLSKFKDFYNIWQESEKYESLHQGATFALKIEPNLILTHYFHLRSNKFNNINSNYFNKIITKPIKNSGICYEYKRDQIYIKNYFYYSDKDCINDLSKKFKLSNSMFDVNKIDEIECVETLNKQKIDLITTDQHFIEEFLKQTTTNSIKQYFLEFAKKSNFLMYSPGIDSNGEVCSIYFIDKNCSNDFIPFDGVKSFISDNV